MLAQGWKGELANLDETECWEVARAWAAHAEATGFDGVWLFDHLQAFPLRDDAPVLELWSTLGALTQSTSEILLGALVACTSFRLPVITAKTAATTGALGRGRFCLGLGAGWDEAEFRAFGLQFPSASRRWGDLEATLLACRTFWADGMSTPNPTEAEAMPVMAPVPNPPPPLMVGGVGSRRTLALAARYADLTNWQVGIEQFCAATKTLESWCARIGRNPADIRRTHAANFQLFESNKEFARWKRGERWRHPSDADAYIRARGALYGTDDRIRTTVEEYVDAGCGGFILYANRSPLLQSIDEMASVLPIAHD
jgi:alkanesulfonate monooxygenase SsuD/methylene tetrahydromethanopterin reductase-like flavin-dependent oxidoreductase (luciferase family)